MTSSTADRTQTELTPTGRVVAMRVASLLDSPVPGPDDNFFALGGSSIQAVWLMTQLAADFGTAPSARELFLAPTIADIARSVDAKLSEGQPTALVRRRRRGGVPP